MRINVEMPFYHEDIEDTRLRKEYIPNHSRKAWLNQSVFLFHNEDSRMRMLEMNSFFDIHFPEVRLNSKSTTNEYWDYVELIKIHRNIEISLRNPIQTGQKCTDLIVKSLEKESQEVKKENEESSVFFNFSLVSGNGASFSGIMRTQTIYECKNIGSYCLEQKKYTSKWLSLMSWWKIINQELQVSGRELYLLLKSIKIGNVRTDEITECAENMEELLTFLGLSFGSAELAAVQQYIPLDKFVPDGKEWCPVYRKLNAYSASEDSRIVAFMTACSYHIVRLTFDFVMTLESDFNADGIMAISKASTVDFYCDVIRSLNIDASYDGFVLPVSIKLTEDFRQLMAEMKRLKEKETSFHLIITLLIKNIHKASNTIVDNREIRIFFGLEVISQILDFILKFILKLSQNALLLCHKVFQKELITVDLLRKLSTNDSHASTCLFEVSCSQIALSFLVAYTCMHNGNRNPEHCFDLPADYKWNDFRSFLEEIRSTTGTETECFRISSQEAFLRMHIIQNHFCEELEKDLSNLTLLANHYNELLHRLRHSLHSYL